MLHLQRDQTVQRTIHQDCDCFQRTRQQFTFIKSVASHSKDFLSSSLKMCLSQLSVNATKVVQQTHTHTHTPRAKEERENKSLPKRNRARIYGNGNTIFKINGYMGCPQFNVKLNDRRFAALWLLLCFCCAIYFTARKCKCKANGK